MEHEGRAQRSAGTPPRPTEDDVTKFIERYTANIPSSMLLGIAVGAMGLSLVSQLSGRGVGQLHRPVGADHHHDGRLQQAREGCRP
jgi:hypothetical protein